MAGEGRPADVACSALKQAYGDRLAQGLGGATFVHLKGEHEVPERGPSRRKDHRRPGLLNSQFEALEEPEKALPIDADDDPLVLAAKMDGALVL